MFLRQLKKEKKEEEKADDSPGDDEKGAFMFSADDMSDLHHLRVLSSVEELGGVEGIALGLKTSFTKGIAKEETKDSFAARREVFGRNVYPEPEHVSFLGLIKEALEMSAPKPAPRPEPKITLTEPELERLIVLAYMGPRVGPSH